tara:strand:- start:596 stop:946 length:351 start_codon:yes stop_codon:yes gene_type:complete
LPIQDQKIVEFCVVSPVTVVAEVDVNIASSNGVNPLLVLENGMNNIKEPMIIRIRIVLVTNIGAVIFEGLLFLLDPMSIFTGLICCFLGCLITWSPGLGCHLELNKISPRLFFVSD